MLAYDPFQTPGRRAVVRRFLLVSVLLCLSGATVAAQPSAPAAATQTPGIRPAGRAVDMTVLRRVDALIGEAIAARQMPGAVLLVGRGPDILYRKAYGNRALLPAQEPMTIDTIFDMASVTKVVATTTAVMILVEEGKVRLNDRVA